MEEAPLSAGWVTGSCGSEGDLCREEKEREGLTPIDRVEKPRVDQDSTAVMKCDDVSMEYICHHKEVTLDLAEDCRVEVPANFRFA
jgi:hypothetical protein